MYTHWKRERARERGMGEREREGWREGRRERMEREDRDREIIHMGYVLLIRAAETQVQTCCIHSL